MSCVSSIAELNVSYKILVRFMALKKHLTNVKCKYTNFNAQNIPSINRKIAQQYNLNYIDSPVPIRYRPSIKFGP